jgi:hypothetical protein
VKFIVTVATLAGPGEDGAGINLNQQVDAANVIEAIDKAKAQLIKTLTAGGLTVTSASASPSA